MVELRGTLARWYSLVETGSPSRESSYTAIRIRTPRPGFLHAFAASLLLCLAARASAQMFAQPTVIPTAGWPLAIYTADLNEDGKPDLVYIVRNPNGSSALHVAINNGQGGFKDTSLGSDYYTSLAVGNLLGNGHVDIGWVDTWSPLTGGPGAIVRIYGGNGDGTFGTPQQATISFPDSTTDTFSYLAAGRLTQGAGLDLIAQDTTTNTLFTFHANQTPANPVSSLNGFLNGFTYHTGITLPDGSGPVAVADLNHDGNPELIVNGQTGFAVDIYTGSPTGIATNAAPTTRFVGENPSQPVAIHSILVTDFFHTGIQDLIAETANGSITVYSGDGTGSFSGGLSNLSSQVNGLAGNGGHIIATTVLKGSSASTVFTATPAGISIPRFLAPSSISYPAIYNAGPGHTYYAAADFNSDGNLDIAVDSPEGIAILYGNSDGSFQTSRAFATGQPAMSGALGVFTSSGNVDAVVSTGAVQAQFLLGKGDGTFWYSGYPLANPVPTSSQGGPAGQWSTIQAADFNGDGFLDIALTADGPNAALPASGSGLTVQLGSASGFAAPATMTAAAQFIFPPSSSCSPPFDHDPAMFYGTSAVGDYNWDGLADIANRDAGAFRIMRGNDGSINGSSTQVPTLYWSGVDGAGTTVDCNRHAHDLVISGDLDNDGHADLIYQGFEGNSGSLIERLSTATGLVSMGDLSVDGSLTTPGQLVAPAISSTFGGVSSTLGFPAFPGSAAIADLDKDGNNDLIVTYANLSANLQAPTTAAPNYIYIWYGSGGGRFLTSAKHPVNPVRLTPSRNFYQVAVADMNLDGIPDLILSDGYIVSVQLGKGDGTFGAEQHFLGGQGINSISVADVNNDGKPDLVLANGGAVLTNPVANLEVLATNPDVNTGGITVLLNNAIPSGLVSTGTVSASPEPTTYGEAFSLTATVSSPLSGTAPTGTVAFSIDGNAIGSANLIGNTATVVPPASIYSTLTVGSHTLTAVYSGDGNYAQETFNGTHTVTLIPTTIGLALCVDPPGSNFPCGMNFPVVAPPLISPVTMYFGQSIDGLATESESDLTGLIIFYNGTSVFCTLDANLQQGSMTCPIASGFFPVGNTQVTVDYTGDATHAASMSNAVQVIVMPDITTATVTSSVSPSLLGQSVTFTANVQGNYAVATGIVTFLDGSTVLGPGTLDATGHAMFTTPSLALGHHAITVAYAGNASFNPTVSPVLTQVVTTVVTGSVISSPEPSYAGNSFAITATVVPPPTSATTIPTGTVAFSIDGTPIGQANLVSGVATLTGPATLAVGNHSVTAIYSGDTNYLTAQFVRGHAVILTPTMTTLLPAGPTTIYYGQPANSSYTVSGIGTTHPPTGDFTVQDNGVSVPYCTAIPLGSSCPYADGGANKLAVGTHALSIFYLGDMYNAPSQSAPLVFTVIPDTTNASLTSSDNPAIVGTSVTFTAKIAGNYATPTGTINFMDGATVLDTATLDGNGGATFTTSALAVGTHPITVVYGATTNFNAATSTVLNQVITNGPTTFTLTVTPSPVTVEIGRDAVLQVTVTATGGFAEPVQLSCPVVPEEATCTFNQTVIPAGGGVTTLYFSPAAPKDCGAETTYAGGPGGRTALAFALACLAVLPLGRRRRVRVVLVPMLALCGLAAMSGCGHCTNLGTRPGNYTVTVTGTAQGSMPLTASQLVPVTVTTVP